MFIIYTYNRCNMLRYAKSTKNKREKEAWLKRKQKNRGIMKKIEGDRDKERKRKKEREKKREK